MLRHIFWSAKDVVRYALSEEGKPPMKVLVIKNEVREGKTVGDFLGIKEFIFQSGTIFFFDHSYPVLAKVWDVLRPYFMLVGAMLE